jgi:hypothetical protein
VLHAHLIFFDLITLLMKGESYEAPASRHFLPLRSKYSPQHPKRSKNENVKKRNCKLGLPGWGLGKVLTTANCKKTGKGKVSVVLTKHHATKTYWGCGDIARYLLNLSTRWMWVVTITSRPLNPQGKSPRYPLDRRLGGSQSRSGRGVEEKKSHHCSCLEYVPRSSRP